MFRVFSVAVAWLPESLPICRAHAPGRARANRLEFIVGGQRPSPLLGRRETEVVAHSVKDVSIRVPSGAAPGSWRVESVIRVSLSAGSQSGWLLRPSYPPAFGVGRREHGSLGGRRAYPPTGHFSIFSRRRAGRAPQSVGPSRQNRPILCYFLASVHNRLWTAGTSREEYRCRRGRC